MVPEAGFQYRLHKLQWLFSFLAVTSPVFLNRGAFFSSVGTKNTTVTFFRLKESATVCTFIKELAGI
ncbi:MAG: hypothetical protein MUP53_03325 [Bacteroidales bacterium]|nr:hypothetical protein [Bacteroidales bacterium]